MSLVVNDLYFSYRGFKVLEGVSFSLEQGQMVCLIGKNGAGKSTLFRCILGMLKNYKGEVKVDGQNLTEYSIQQAAAKIAYIPQAHHGVYNYSVIDMILMGTTSALGKFQVPKQKERDTVEEAMRMVGIEHLKGRTYQHISGGEQQLVLIARALAQKAKILIMDEPCANLDYGNQIHILEVMKNLSKNGYLILQSTHNPEHAFLYADQVLVLNQHKIVAQGDPYEVLNEKILFDIYDTNISLCNIGNIKVCIPSNRLPS